MTPDKLAAFRISLRNEMWKAFPRAEAATIWSACERIERLMIQSAFNLVEMDHGRDCACWHCLTTLLASIARTNAERRVAQQAAHDHD